MTSDELTSECSGLPPEHRDRLSDCVGMLGCRAQYKGGVYRRSKQAQGPLGGHAVKIVGWGVEEGRPYWTAMNSWSPLCGDRGFIKIAGGTNECGIEETPAAGMPGEVVAATPLTPPK